MAGGFTNGAIHLDSSPVFVFYSGQLVSGSIQFELDEPITFSVIYIHFLGEANVSWSESEIETVNGVQRNKLIKYEGREEYFNYTCNLLGGGAGTSQLPAGSHAIPFKFQIPFTAPSSFKGEQGRVSYSMTAHLVTPEHIHVHDVIAKEFQVVAPFDLNSGSPKIKEPIDLEFEEVYGCDCFCLSSNPVTVRVRLPVSGYCPGQVIPVAIEVENESNVEITKMIFEIFSKELYRSQHPSSEYILPETVLSTTKKGPVMSKSKRNFTCDVAIPEILPPYLENCGIIDVGYFFRITIKLSGCNDDLQDEAEICLGLVPVREFTEGEYVHPLAHSLPTGPIPDPNNTTEFLPPPVTAEFRGSNTSLQRVQYNPAQAQLGPYSSNPPPYVYPSGNGNYPSENKFQTSASMEMKPKPYQDYDIGFKVPEAVPGGNAPGYPTGGPGYPTGGPGYPTGGPGYPTGGPGYPTGGPGYPTGGPGYPTGGPGYPTGGPGYPTNAPSGMNPPSYASTQSTNPTGNQMPVNTGGSPYAQGGFQPSAPPPN